MFSGDVDGYPEGELWFPNSPVLTVTGAFGEAVLLETLALSVLNHDCAIASAGSRMVTAAAGRPIIEMGSRRTHDDRLDRTHAALAEGPSTPYEVSLRLFATDLSPMLRRFATAEALAHLVRLAAEGRAERTEDGRYH